MSAAKRKVLVFGATGSIGVYLVEWLVAHLPPESHEIVAIGRRKTDYFRRYGVEYLSMDVSRKEDYRCLPQENIHAAIDLANVLPARMKTYDPESYLRINTLGTLYLLEYLRSVRADRMLFTQTYADLAGHWDTETVLSNRLPCKLKYTGDHALYAISKCAAVELMENYHQEYGLKNFVFRLPNIYMYSPEKTYYVDGKETLVAYRYLIDRAIQGLPIEMWGDPMRIRDIVYVKDLCRMLAAATTVEGVDGGVFNVGTGVGTTMQEQIEGIVKVFSPENAPSPILPRPDKTNSMQYVMDISEAREKLGYRPAYGYLDYLRDYKKEMHSRRFEGL